MAARICSALAVDEQQWVAELAAELAAVLSGGNHLQLPLGAVPGSAIVSNAAKGSSRPISGELNGSRKGSSRPISALLNGSKELADLVSASKPRYADHMPAASLEPSAEVLHGQCSTPP